MGVIAAETPWLWGYCPYYNPYCTAPVVVEGTTIDYSQPIVLAQPAAASSQTSEPKPDAAGSGRLIDAAREEFAEGDYPAALKLVNRAVAAAPSDPLLQQFRALTLFAQGNYKEAAACLYATLSVGPGWDWSTLRSFYPDAEAYNQQLRALEKYVLANPGASDARFVLASHYLTCGYDAAAKAQLEKAVELNPKDHLSAQLLRSLGGPKTAELKTADQKSVDLKPAAPQSPAKPLVAAALVAADVAGTWSAQQPDGTAITLKLTGNDEYSWKVVRQDKPREFNGTFTLADNVLILKQGDAPALVGQIALKPDGSLTFKLAGSPPGDDGLTFRK